MATLTEQKIFYPSAQILQLPPTAAVGISVNVVSTYTSINGVPSFTSVNGVT